MKKIITIIALVLLLVGSAVADRGIVVRPISPTGETMTGSQWLFVIGINTYLQWPKLATAVNDAKAIRDVLLSKYYFDKEHLIELYDTDATRKNILSSLVNLAKQVKPEDSLLIYYSGHGNLDPITKEGSWVPVESSTQDPSAWISNHDIKNYLKSDAIKAKHILLISDSCFAGDFFRTTRGALPEVTDMIIKKAYQRTSREAITSGGVEPVSDSGFKGNSVFSHFVIETLKQNNKPFLIPSDLFPSVKAGVIKNAEQFPQYGALYDVGGQEGGEYVFFLKQEDKLQILSTESKERQQELEHLKKMELEAAKAKEKEQLEISKKEKEVAALDSQIAEMKLKLNASPTYTSDSLQSILTMVEKKEAEGKKLEELKKQREAEQAKRQAEIERLKAEAFAKRAAEAKKDLLIYERIANSPYGKDMIPSAWKILISKYPECIKLEQGDVIGFKEVFSLSKRRYCKIPTDSPARYQLNGYPMFRLGSKKTGQTDGTYYIARSIGATWAVFDGDTSSLPHPEDIVPWVEDFSCRGGIWMKWAFSKSSGRNEWIPVYELDE